MDPVEISRYEDQGYFLKILFEGDEETTLLFVTDRDFESLLRMADPDQHSWEDFRRELLLLLEHSGHKETKELGKDRASAIRRILREFRADDDRHGT